MRVITVVRLSNKERLLAMGKQDCTVVSLHNNAFGLIRRIREEMGGGRTRI